MKEGESESVRERGKEEEEEEENDVNKWIYSIFPKNKVQWKVLFVFCLILFVLFKCSPPGKMNNEQCFLMDQIEILFIHSFHSQKFCIFMENVQPKLSTVIFIF